MTRSEEFAAAVKQEAPDVRAYADGEVLKVLSSQAYYRCERCGYRLPEEQEGEGA